MKRRTYCGLRANARKGQEHICKRKLNHRGRCICNCGTKFKPQRPYKPAIIRVVAILLS